MLLIWDEEKPKSLIYSNLRQLQKYILKHLIKLVQLVSILKCCSFSTAALDNHGFASYVADDINLDGA